MRIILLSAVVLLSVLNSYAADDFNRQARQAHQAAQVRLHGTHADRMQVNHQHAVQNAQAASNAAHQQAQERAKAKAKK